jgi:hypothetical protein
VSRRAPLTAAFLRGGNRLARRRRRPRVDRGGASDTTHGSKVSDTRFVLLAADSLAADIRDRYDSLFSQYDSEFDGHGAATSGDGVGGALGSAADASLSEPENVAAFVKSVHSSKSGKVQINLDTEKQPPLWIAGKAQTATINGRSWGSHTRWNCALGCSEPKVDEQAQSWNGGKPPGISDLINPPTEKQRADEQLRGRAAEERARELKLEIERFIARSPLHVVSPVRAMYIEPYATLSMVRHFPTIPAPCATLAGYCCSLGRDASCARSGLACACMRPELTPSLRNCYCNQSRICLHGAGIRVRGPYAVAKVQSSKFYGVSHPSNRGGAASIIDGGALDVRGSWFGHNTAKFGGAIYVATGGKVHAGFCLYEHNRALASGGAVTVISNGTFECSSCELRGNSAGGSGGAVAVLSDGLLEASFPFFKDSHAGQSGGAIFGYESGRLILSGPEFCNNSVGKIGKYDSVLHSPHLHEPALPGVPGNSEFALKPVAHDEDPGRSATGRPKERESERQQRILREKLRAREAQALEEAIEEVSLPGAHMRKHAEPVSLSPRRWR